MGNPSGGKTKQPDARTVAVKLGQHERGLLAEIVYRRIEKGAGYDQTTQAGVVKDAIRYLAELELGKKTVEATVPGVHTESVAPLAPFVGPPPGVVETPETSQAQLQAEYTAFSQAEGLAVPWEHFLTIRKLRIQKGVWAYGPNTL